MATKAEEIEMLFQNAIQNVQVPKIYANGFANAVGQGDTTTVLQQNGVPVAVLNLSFTVAKTLAKKLGGIITEFEQQTGNTIMTTDECASALSREKAKKSGTKAKKPAGKKKP